MTRIFVSIGVLSLLVLMPTCSSPTETINNSITLSVDVSSTEAWLNLNVNNAALPKSVTITRDGKSLLNFTLTTRDTTLYDSTLTPNRSYTYQAIINPIGGQSDKVIATTLDTTSNNFTWQTFTFGEGSSSSLYDVAIINENDIWAVGEIYTKDSYTYDTLGNWIDPYNAIHWDGTQWKLERIYYNYNGSKLWGPIRTIFAFSENDIWFGTNLHWNGKMYEQPGVSVLTGWSANKIWGTSSNNLYAVGNNGNIAWFNGTTWQKIESGTKLDLYDIYSNNGKDIYVSGGNFSTSEGVLLKGNSSGFQILEEGKNISTQLFNPYFAGIAKTVWVSDNNNVYFGGNLLYRYKNGSVGFVKTLPGNYLYGNVNGQYWGFISMIRGEKDNDIILVGEGNTIRHFNGVGWQQLGTAYDYNSEYTWLSVAQKENTIAVVGRSSSQGIIMILKRK